MFNSTSVQCHFGFVPYRSRDKCLESGVNSTLTYVRFESTFQLLSKSPPAHHGTDISTLELWFCARMRGDFDARALITAAAAPRETASVRRVRRVSRARQPTVRLNEVRGTKLNYKKLRFSGLGLEFVESGMGVFLALQLASFFHKFTNNLQLHTHTLLAIMYSESYEEEFIFAS